MKIGLDEPWCSSGASSSIASSSIARAAEAELCPDAPWIGSFVEERTVSTAIEYRLAIDSSFSENDAHLSNQMP